MTMIRSAASAVQVVQDKLIPGRPCVLPSSFGSMSDLTQNEWLGRHTTAALRHVKGFLQMRAGENEAQQEKAQPADGCAGSARS
jgi:hypothetical protein